MIDDCYINNLTKIEICAVFHSRVIWRSVVTSVRSSSFAQELRYIEINTSSRARTVLLAKTYIGYTFVTVL